MNIISTAKITNEMKAVKEATHAAGKQSMELIKGIDSFETLFKHFGKKGIVESIEQRKVYPTIMTCERLFDENIENYDAIDENKIIDFRKINHFGNMYFGGYSRNENDQSEGQRRTASVLVDLLAMNGVFSNFTPDSFDDSLFEDYSEIENLILTIKSLIYSDECSNRLLDLSSNNEDHYLEEIYKRSEKGDNFTKAEEKDHPLYSTYNYMFKRFDLFNSTKAEDLEKKKELYSNCKKFIYGLFVPGTLCVFDCHDLDSGKVFLSNNLDGEPIDDINTALTVLCSSMNNDTSKSKSEFTNEIRKVYDDAGISKAFKDAENIPLDISFSIYAMDVVKTDRPTINGERITISENSGYKHVYKEVIRKKENIQQECLKSIEPLRLFKDFLPRHPEYIEFFNKSNYGATGLYLIKEILKNYSNNVLTKDQVEKMLDQLFSALMRCSLCGTSGLCLQNQFKIIEKLNDANWKEAPTVLNSAINELSKTAENNASKAIPTWIDTKSFLENTKISFSSAKRARAVKATYFATVVNEIRDKTEGTKSIDQFVKANNLWDSNSLDNDHFIERAVLEDEERFNKYFANCMPNCDWSDDEKKKFKEGLKIEVKDIIYSFANVFTIPYTKNRFELSDKITLNKKRDYYLGIGDDFNPILNVVKDHDFSLNPLDEMKKMLPTKIDNIEPVLNPDYIKKVSKE